MDTKKDLRPKLTVIGVGGAGSNAVNNMIRSGLGGVHFIVCNTDAQALEESLCDVKIQLGPEITQGLGAGSRPDVGKASAEESLDEVMSHLKGSNMVFITAGMGGGTGTGGAPVIAKAAKDAGILTVGVVTKPFHFEGSQRMHAAEAGIETMNQSIDTLLVIPNQNLFRLATETTTFSDAFAMADDVLYSGVRTFTDLMIKHGLINLDFADICAVMREMIGKAMMGTGQASGERRAIDAAEQAISCPLLESDVTMKGARAVLINITGGPDMTLFEVDEAANRVREEMDPEAKIIFGATYDQSLNGEIRVAVVATGIDAEPCEKLAEEEESVLPESIFHLNNETLPEPPVELSSAFEESFNRLGNMHSEDTELLGRRHDLFSKKSDDSLDPEEESLPVFHEKKNVFNPQQEHSLDDSDDGRAEKKPEKPSNNRRALNLLERLGVMKPSPVNTPTPPSPPTRAQDDDAELTVFEDMSKMKSKKRKQTPSSELEDEEADIPAFMRSKQAKK